MAELDDFDARPGSTTSLLRTVIGLYLRDLDGHIATRTMVLLLESLGISPAHTRTALARVRRRGLLDTSPRAGIPGYALQSAARHMLERGDRRIFHPRSMTEDDRWCLLSFTVPESERDRRHQLRRRLSAIGCGTVAPGLWICPDFLRDEVEEIVEDLGMRDRTVLFVTDTPLTGGTLADSVAQWWDLGAVAALHHEFLESTAALLTAANDPAAAFSHYVRSIDSWRAIPYLDPGLAPSVLPADWPGPASTARFARLRELFEVPAALHVAALRAAPSRAG